MNPEEKKAEVLKKARLTGTFDILHSFSKRKWLYFSIAMISGMITFAIMKWYVLSYSSTTTFYLSDPSSGSNGAMPGEMKPLDIIRPSDQYNKVYQLVNSHRVLNHLIRKFNLVDHYRIDSLDEFYMEKTIHILKDNIVVKRTPFNSIAVTVSDAHRYLAADIANELINYTDRLNQEIMMEHLSVRLNIFKAVLEDTRQANNERSMETDSMIKSLNTLVSRLENRPLNSLSLLAMQTQLSNLVNSLQSSTEDLNKLIRYYSTAYHTLHTDELPSIVVIQVALPSYRSNAIIAVMFAGLVFILVIISGIFNEYFRLRYLPYLRLMVS